MDERSLEEWAKARGTHQDETVKAAWELGVNLTMYVNLLSLGEDNNDAPLVRAAQRKLAPHFYAGGHNLMGPLYMYDEFQPHLMPEELRNVLDMYLAISSIS